MLYREPKLLKADPAEINRLALQVSVLYREPKLLKASIRNAFEAVGIICFSALP